MLVIKKLSKIYPNKVKAISNLSVTLKQASCNVLIGESGSGKSSLLRCINGLERINSGSIILEGNVLDSDSIYIKPEQRKIDYSSQEPVLFPFLNVIDNIYFGNDEFEENISGVVDLLGIQDLVLRKISELSGGQKQRVSLARTLSREGKLVLMDEPFSSLDIETKREVRKVIYDLIRKRKQTLLLVSHDIEDAYFLADMMFVMKDGCIVQYGTPEQIYNQPVNAYVASLFDLTDRNNSTNYADNFYIDKEGIEYSVLRVKFYGNRYLHYLRSDDGSELNVFLNNKYLLDSRIRVSRNS